jgi:diaminopimelate decarboxylase
MNLGDGADQPGDDKDDSRGHAWRARVARAVEQVGTPCFVGAWAPVQSAVEQLDALIHRDGNLSIRHWLSFKTQPLPILARRWLREGRGVEVVSEAELVTVLNLGVSTDQLLVNGVAKHEWLGRFRLPGLRVHFDSLGELDGLLAVAVAQRWRVGIRCHVPDERDAQQPQFGGQFGLTSAEALAAIEKVRRAGADLQSVHFHLGQRRQDAGAYARAIAHVAAICDRAAFAPRFLDCGGGLPPPGDPRSAAVVAGLAQAIQSVAARLPALEEVWLENGRFITEESAALAVRIVDVKERSDSRYLICDGGRTNHALAADTHPHPILVPAHRSGPLRLTTICGPTCMTDDRLGRWLLPDDVGVGDLIVWLQAGAYHLPWETRFSHGLCAVAWYDEDTRVTVARRREEPRDWARHWTGTELHSHA